MLSSSMRSVLIALLALCLTACGLFSGDRRLYESSQTERPLEVPPGLDNPGLANALTIPGPGGTVPSAAVSGTPVGVSGEVGGRLSSVQLADSPDNAFSRVALAIERAGIAAITARDEAAGTITVSGSSVTSTPVERGFFGRLLGRSQTRSVSQTVIRVVRIAPNADGSLVTVEDQSGGPASDDLAARLLSALRQRLG